MDNGMNGKRTHIESIKRERKKIKEK